MPSRRTGGAVQSHRPLDNKTRRGKIERKLGRKAVHRIYVEEGL